MKVENRKKERDRKKLLDHLVAVNISVKQTRIGRMRENFGLDDAGNILSEREIWSDGRWFRFGKQFIGSEHRNPIAGKVVGGGKEGVVIEGKDRSVG